MNTAAVSKHPWELLPGLVEAEILTKEQAARIVLAHEEANRRALLEIHALIPDLLHQELIEEAGAKRIRDVVTKAAREGMPDL